MNNTIKKPDCSELNTRELDTVLKIAFSTHDSNLLSRLIKNPNIKSIDYTTIINSYYIYEYKDMFYILNTVVDIKKLDLCYSIRNKVKNLMLDDVELLSTKLVHDELVYYLKENYPQTKYTNNYIMHLIDSGIYTNVDYTLLNGIVISITDLLEIKIIVKFIEVLAKYSKDYLINLLSMVKYNPFVVSSINKAVQYVRSISDKEINNNLEKENIDLDEILIYKF